MPTKNIIKTTLAITTAIIGSISISNADQASLSEDLRLHIPIIHFQNQYLWADLDHQPTPSEPITFTVRDFGFLPKGSIPPQLHDLSLVTNGLPPTIVDIKNTEARLTFTSSIPLACSVIYGKTPGFGAVATDANMNGGAIIDHNPILTNLEANTLYYYRVQGTDAEGKLYWQPTETFTTISIANNNLLSLNNGAKIAAVSSNFGNTSNDKTWGANSAIDDSNNTAWSSNGDGDNAFIEIALAEPVQIDTLEIWSRSMSDGTAKIFSFTISLDNGETLGPVTLPNTEQAHQFPLNRTTASIRLDVVSSSGGNTGLRSISAYTNQ